MKPIDLTRPETKYWERPNGKYYSRRKLPNFEVYGDYDKVVFVMWRTHSFEELDHEAFARWFAEAIDNWGFNIKFDSRQDWLRGVPWDDSGEYDRSVIRDTARGVPCLVFTITPTK